MAVFEIGGGPAPALLELAVGPWTAAPPRLMTFDAGARHPEAVWRVDLARDVAASRAALAGGERSVARTHTALDDVPRRLERALELALAGPARAPRSGATRDDRGGAGGPGGPGAAAPRRAAPPTPESALIAALAGADAGDLLSSGGGPDPLMSWSADPTASPRSPGWLERALDRVVDLARGRARIETQVEGALVAHSVMTVSGHTELWIAPRLSPASAGLHARSVAVALRTRHAWARILALVVSSGGRIAVLGLPAAGASVLPAVWRFVHGVLSEVSDRTAAARPA